MELLAIVGLVVAVISLIAVVVEIVRPASRPQLQPYQVGWVFGLATVGLVIGTLLAVIAVVTAQIQSPP